MDAAASVIQRGNNKIAGYELNAFIHEVSAQPGKGMTSEQSAELGTRAKQADSELMRWATEFRKAEQVLSMPA